MIRTQNNLDALDGVTQSTPVTVTMPDGTIVAGYFHHLFSAPLESIAIRTEQGLQPFPLNIVDISVN